MKIYVDIDNTIFKTNKMDYNKITPITKILSRLINYMIKIMIL